MNVKSQMMAKKLAEIVEPLAEELGYDLIDLQFIEGRRRSIVRVFIDKDGGVSLDDCAALSRRLSDRLDVLDVPSGPYNLEVSSPGIDRPFTSLKQYMRSLGKEIDVVLAAPLGKSSQVQGTLVEVSDGQIHLRVGKGEVVVVPMARIKRASRVLTLGRSAGSGGVR
ncbi:MAG: ribosome maturation factor RimP [Candidatus Riflebacteria bacterium]|nr:ribosome maturation factor RimP [Candidatus Riflebacteria bacterium]